MSAVPKCWTLADRFWRHADKSAGPDGCWPWTGWVSDGGYGVTHDMQRVVWKAHRMAWTLANGPIPEGEGFHGTCVLHRCDNPICCNPAHLFLGTQQDNIADMLAKGRHRVPVGSQRGIAKLTEAAVLVIRACPRRYGYRVALAKRFGVSAATIDNVLYRHGWRHVRGATNGDV